MNRPPGFASSPPRSSDLSGGTGDRTTRPADDVRPFVHKVADLRVRPLDPRSVIVVSLVLQAVDDSRPIEPGSAIISVLRVRQVDLCPNLTIRDLRAREIRRRQDSNAHGHGSQNQSLCYHRMDYCMMAGGR